MSDKQEEEPLPPTLIEARELTLPSPITAEADLQEHLTITADHMNNAMKVAYASISAVRSVTSACKVATTIASLAKTQRELMLKPSSYSDYKDEKKKVYGFETLE